MRPTDCFWFRTRIRTRRSPFRTNRSRLRESVDRCCRPDYIDAITEDDDTPILGVTPGNGDDLLYDQAVALVCRERKASTSFVQRHLQIGYNRAARIIERMEAEGVISRANHVGRREVLANDIAGDTLD